MNHKARKRFGQNFLHDHNVIYNILANIQAQPNEHWVEIGPGLGAITEPLLDKKVITRKIVSARPSSSDGVVGGIIFNFGDNSLEIHRYTLT